MRRATSAQRAGSKLRKKPKTPLDAKVADKLRKALRDKCAPPYKQFFRKYDRDRSGELSTPEFEDMLRTGLKLTKRDVSVVELRALVASMDTDASGTLSLAELAAFVANKPASPSKKKSLVSRILPKASALSAFTSKGPAEPLAPPFRRPRPPGLDADALKRFRDGVNASLGHYADARTALEDRITVGADAIGILSPRSVLRVLREDLGIDRSIVRDGDAEQVLKLVDIDGYGTLALDDLASFIERGPQAFYNATQLPGKSLSLPKPPGSEAGRFGRVVGALEARLNNGETRTRFASIDIDGDGKVKADAFRKAVRGAALHLSEKDLDGPDLDALVSLCDATPGGRKVYEVDLRRVAFLSKRGGDCIDGLYDTEKAFFRKTADQRSKTIKRSTAEGKYDDWAAKQPKPDPRTKVPELGPRLIPSNLFGWLDDPHGYSPVDAPKLSSRDDSAGPSDLDALKKLRDALDLHEALGQPLAAGSVLLKLGRRLRNRSLARFFPRGIHRSKELRCAGEALDAAASLFRTYFDDAGHHLNLIALYEAADAFVEAEDELVNALSRVRGPAPDDLDEAASTERSILLRFARRSLTEFQEAYSLLDVTALNPKEIMRYANGLALFAVVQSRQPAPEEKIQRSFDAAERLHAALDGDVASLAKAEWHRRRAFERLRAGHSATALESMQTRETLLTSALGADHAETVGARRLRVLWSRGLGGGAGIGGNAPEVVA